MSHGQWWAEVGQWEEVETAHINPPIPDRSHDWSSTHKGYEPGDPQGFGPTEPEAIQALREADQAFLESLEEKYPSLKQWSTQ